MADVIQHNLNDGDELSEAQLLLSIIADGEASDSQRARFDELASIDQSLWRELACAQQVMTKLEADFDRELFAANRVDLPAPVVHHKAATSPLRFPWIAAGLGWAAVLALAAIWIATNDQKSDSDSLNHATPAKLPPAVELRGDDALDQYLKAPWVRGQLQPTLLDIETLPDGTKRLWILRRIEEYIDLPADALVPVDDKNELVDDPANLRGQSTQQSLGPRTNDG